MSEDNTAQPQIVAAFIVGFDADGNPFIDVSQETMKIETRRQPTMIEIRRYLSEILMDLQAQATSEYTAQRLSPTTPSGLITPNRGAF